MAISVFIRVDASVTIGTGHLYRCLALATQLKSRGAECTFLCRGLSSAHEALISSADHDLERLRTRDRSVNGVDADSYSNWLEVTEEEDAEAVCASLHGVDSIVVVDHYAIGKDWEVRVRDHCASVVAIDDLVRVHDVDILIDQTPGRLSTAYSASSIGTALTGGEYALLADEFNVTREKRKRLATSSGMDRLVVSMGGVDSSNVTERVVAELFKVSQHYQLIGVVLPRAAPHHPEVARVVGDAGPPFKLYDTVSDMPEFMESFDLAIGAPGVSSLERLAIGLPSILIPIASNQMGNAKIMADSGAAVVVDSHDMEGLSQALEKLHDSASQVRDHGMRLVDALGARRAAQHILPEYIADGRSVTLRKARVEDISMAYEWQQHPETRRFARNPKCPTWQEHSLWMKSRLDASDCFFYIICVDSISAGVVRLDKVCSSDNVYELSVHVDTRYKRCGVATSAIRLVLDLHRDCEILAEVLESNDASHALFRKLGFTRKGSTQYLTADRRQ